MQGAYCTDQGACVLLRGALACTLQSGWYCNVLYSTAPRTCTTRPVQLALPASVCLVARVSPASVVCRRRVVPAVAPPWACEGVTVTSIVVTP